MRATGAAVLTLLLLVGGSACSGDDAADTDLPLVELDASATEPVDTDIRAAQERLRADADDLAARVELAAAFLRKARTTGDPAYYDRVERLTGGVLEEQPDDLVTMLLRGSVLLSQHRFEDALELGRRALDLAPSNPTALGITVDALNELGRYDEALDATQAMVDVRPDLPSLARVSFARELRGDLAGAVLAMSQAVSAGSSEPLDVAFAQTQLGNLLLLSGDPEGAADAYEAALAAAPEVVAARAGQARLAVAEGDPARAADLLAEAVARNPLPELAIAHADALEGAGRADEAADARELVDVLFTLQSEAGVTVELELALFLADQGRADEAVELAEQAVERRPNVAAWDALAWASFRAGDLSRAVEAVERSTALGSVDPLIRYHAAEIAAADGDEAAAAGHLQVVLDTNPRFSAVLADDVVALADRLGLELAGG